MLYFRFDRKNAKRRLSGWYWFSALALNKICSEFGQNQSGSLKGLFLVDSLDEKRNNNNYSK